MQSLANLRQPITRAEGLARVLEMFQALGFDTTGWQEGRIQRTIMTVLATFIADQSEVDRIVANGGFNEHAQGVLLELFSKSRYQNQKLDARATSGLLRLTNVSPTAHNLKTGASIAATANGVQFRLAQDVVVAAGTVASPVTTLARYTAMIRGAAGNVPTGAINTLVTPLAGVTVTNTGTPWYDISGRDLEADSTLQTRNVSQWSRLSVEYVKQTYANIAQDLGAAKVEVDDNNPRGAGTIDVYPTGPSALLSNAELTSIQEAYAERAFDTDSTWPASGDSRVSVKHPPVLYQNISAILYHDPGVAGSVIDDRATTALLDYLAETPIGGWDYTPGPANVLLLGDIYDRLKDVEGVSGVEITFPTTSPAVGTLSLVAQGSWVFTKVPRTNS